MGFFFVFVGSGIGGMARHGVGLLSLRAFGPSFPFGTLIINIVGSAAMGLIVALLNAFNLGHQEARLFLTTGIVGGFTTFSTFSLDAAVLWQRGERAWAVGYVLASVSLSLAALFASMHIARRLG